jgi:K+-sensing histidine kinase KdpD
MASVIASRSRSLIDSIGQPNLRLVKSDPGRVLDLPAQSPKTAVMACIIAGNVGNSDLLRKASVAARESNGEFYAVLVDSPRDRLRTAGVRALIDDAILASYLGARIIWLESSDVVGELLRFAQQSDIGRIFVARNRPTRFPRLFGRTICSELLSRAREFRIDVVGFNRTGA